MKLYLLSLLWMTLFMGGINNMNDANAFVTFAPTTTKTMHHPLNSPINPVLSSSGKKRVSSVALEISPTHVSWALWTVALTTAASSVKIVQQGNVTIIERFGKFKQCLEPGLHFVIPIADQAATSISQREQVFDIPPQKCITLDNAPLLADAVVYWKVIDPLKAFYSIENLDIAIQNLVLTQLRVEIGKISLDDTFSAREQINSVLLQNLDEETATWGIQITRVEVRDIIPNTEILSAMEMQMAAERKKRAVMIQSEGEKFQAITEAEGEAQSLIIDAKADAESLLLKARAEAEKVQLEAEGDSKAIEALAKILNDPSEAAKYKLAQQFIETQGRLATSENAKVVLSNSDGRSDALIKALAIYSD